MATASPTDGNQANGLPAAALLHAIDARPNIEISEADYPSLENMDGLVSYRADRAH